MDSMFLRRCIRELSSTQSNNKTNRLAHEFPNTLIQKHHFTMCKAAKTWKSKIFKIISVIQCIVRWGTKKKKIDTIFMIQRLL